MKTKLFYTVVFLILLMLGFTAPVYAGILTAIVGSVIAAPVISSIIGTVVIALARIIPNDKIQFVIGGSCRFAGNFISGFFNHWKWTKAFWDQGIEKIFIDLIDNTVSCAIREFIVGLRLDNKPD